MQRPGNTKGLRHVALFVTEFEACENFYCELLGMRVEWRPDPDNVYLTSGFDNLALHRAQGAFAPQAQQRLDHIGFILASPDAVTQWHDFLKHNHVKLHSEVKHHRDGAVSFYCADPDGNVVQMIYHPPLANS